MISEAENRLLHLIDDPLNLSGILLYGSRASPGADPQSDFDLICVLRSPWEDQRRDVQPFEDVYLDLYYASFPVLRRRLQTQNLLNNNFVLNAFADGKVLADRDGSVAKLIDLARAIWARGPVVPSAGESRFVQEQFRATYYSIQRLFVRACESSQQEGLARLRAAELFSRMMYEYCHRAGVWAASMSNVLRWTEKNCLELHARACQYLAAQSNHEMIVNLEQILQFLEQGIASDRKEKG
jgi:hypothetical protein